jgi:hypothetical protein
VCHDGVGVAEGRRVWIGASKGGWGRMMVVAMSGGRCGFVASGGCCWRRVGFGAAVVWFRRVGFGAAGVWVRRVGFGAAVGWVRRVGFGAAIGCVRRVGVGATCCCQCYHCRDLQDGGYLRRRGDEESPQEGGGLCQEVNFRR